MEETACAKRPPRSKPPPSSTAHSVRWTARVPHDAKLSARGTCTVEPATLSHTLVSVTPADGTLASAASPQRSDTATLAESSSAADAPGNCQVTGRLIPAKAEGEGVLDRETPRVVVPVAVFVRVAERDAGALPDAAALTLTLPVALEWTLVALLALGEPLINALPVTLREGCGEGEALAEPLLENRPAVPVARPVASPVAEKRADLLAAPVAAVVSVPQRDVLTEALLFSVKDEGGLAETVAEGAPLGTEVNEKDSEEAEEDEGAVDAVPKVVAVARSVAASEAETCEPDEERVAA